MSKYSTQKILPTPTIYITSLKYAAIYVPLSVLRPHKDYDSLKQEKSPIRHSLQKSCNLQPKAVIFAEAGGGGGGGDAAFYL
jgi:hypothetical protein